MSLGRLTFHRLQSLDGVSMRGRHQHAAIAALPMGRSMTVWKAQWQSALDRLCGRVLEIHRLVGDAWPYHCTPGELQWDTTVDGDWCGGHWVECLRSVGELTGGGALFAGVRLDRPGPLSHTGTRGRLCGALDGNPRLWNHAHRHASAGSFDRPVGTRQGMHR